MSNFDLRKFLAEGKLYEEAASIEKAMGKPSTKMKMSELKKKIRQEILSELTLNEDDKISVGGAESGGVNTDPVYEATKDGDGEVPSKDTDTDVDIIDKEKVEVDVEKKPKATGVDDDFLDQLEDLQDEAEEIGDNKLERQIANTITYFTRQHIAQDANESIELEEADDMALVADLEAELTEGYNEFKRARKGSKGVTAKNKAEEEVYGAGVKKGEEIEKKKLQKESLEILKMKKLAGLITEGEYAKALLNERFVGSEPFAQPHERLLELVEMYVDNFFDGGMDAKSTVKKIDDILQGKLDGYDQAFMKGEEDQY